MVHVLVIQQHTSPPLATVLSVLVDLLESVGMINCGVEVYLEYSKVIYMTKDIILIVIHHVYSTCASQEALERNPEP